MAAGAAAGLSALAAAGLRAALLLDDRWAHGYDGWYYVLQVRSWLAGTPLFDDRSLAFVFLAALARIVGDVALSNKLAACLLGAVTAGAGAVAAWRWTGAAVAAAVCGMAWALSPLHLSLSAEFLKNSAGLAVLALLLAVLPGCERRRPLLLAAVGLALLGPMVHKMTGVMGLLAAGGYAASHALAGRLSPRLLGGLALAGLLSLATLGVLRPVDLARFTGEGSAASSRLAAFTGGRLLPSEQIALLLVHLAPLVLMLLLLLRPPRVWDPARHATPSQQGVGGVSVWGMGVGVLLLSVVSVAPGLPFGWELTSWRLLLMGFVPVGLLAARLVAAAPPRQAWTVVTLGVAVGLGGAPSAIEAGQRRSPDYAGWAEVVPLLQAAVPPGARVVAHRGLCGFIWAEAGIVCENFHPQGDPEGWWRVAYGFSAERLSAHSTPEEAPPLTLRPGYLLVPETTWRRFLATEGARFRLTRDPRNPFETRPAYVYGPGGATPPDTRPPPHAAQ